MVEEYIDKSPRICNGCGKTKEFELFTKCSKKRADGSKWESRSHICLACTSERSQARRAKAAPKPRTEAQKAADAARAREKYHADAAKARAERKARRDANPEAAKAAQAKWHAENPGAKAEYNAKYKKKLKLQKLENEIQQLKAELGETY